MHGTIWIDLLHALTDVESDPPIGSPPSVAVMVPTRTHRDPAADRRNCCVSPSEGCGPARSLRPHRNRNRNRNRDPCHRCATHRESAAPCGSGPASPRFRRSFSHVGPTRSLSVGHPSRFPSEGCGRCVPVTAAPPEDGGMRSPLYHATQKRQLENQRVSIGGMTGQSNSRFHA
jgi:hypothetical protein